MRLCGGPLLSLTRVPGRTTIFVIPIRCKMAVPDFQSIMLPLLKQVSDGKEYSIKSLVSILTDQMKLTEEEQNQLLSSGQTRFYNRVAWAGTYLRKAGLLNSPKRATVTISDRGREVLNSNVERITTSYLNRFPESVEFQ